MGIKLFKQTLLLMILILLAAAQALAQDSDYQEAEMIEAEPIRYDWFVEEDWGLRAILPLGGQYHTAEDLGIGAEDDPMNYPLIWISEDLALPFNLVMFGALPTDVEITAEDYDFYFEEFKRNVQFDFPIQQQPDDAVDIHDRNWDRFVVANSDGSVMINYLTYEGEVFYSASFLGGSMTELADAVEATVEQLDLIFMPDDFIPEEEPALPWYF